MTTAPRSLVRLAVPLVILGVVAAAGCGKPNRANIGLRREIQTLRGQVATLARERDAARAEVAGLREQQGTIPSLPTERLDKLFTTHGIQLGRLTGGADIDRVNAGDEGVRAFVTPVDGSGQKLKAAGSVVVEAFDLGADGARVGRWEFDTAKAAENWQGSLMRYEYVLTCPWEQPPANADLTLKVTFKDELTGRSFTQQRPVKVAIPAATTAPTPEAAAAPAS